MEQQTKSVVLQAQIIIILHIKASISQNWTFILQGDCWHEDTVVFKKSFARW